MSRSCNDHKGATNRENERQRGALHSPRSPRRLVAEVSFDVSQFKLSQFETDKAVGHSQIQKKIHRLNQIKSVLGRIVCVQIYWQRIVLKTTVKRELNYYALLKFLNNIFSIYIFKKRNKPTAFAFLHLNCKR